MSQGMILNHTTSHTKYGHDICLVLHRKMAVLDRNLSVSD